MKLQFVYFYENNLKSTFSFLISAYQHFSFLKTEHLVKQIYVPVFLQITIH
jgi:hypothetical protein